MKILDFIRRFDLARPGGDERGIAAVEFALVLPLMVTLYVGSSEVTQGVLASRKMAIVSRTLADLVAQQPTAATSPCATAGLCDSTMTAIFSAANAIMSPFSTAALSGGVASLTMTVSSVDFVANGATPAPATVANGYEAYVRWSVTASSPNAGATRSCANKLTPVSNSTAPALDNLPSGLFGAGSLIVADVTYNYQPTFGGSVLAWAGSGGATYVAMKNTTYMRPRNWTTYITYPSQNGVGTSCTG
jgi:Flp pilus assembly protein TadG